MAVHLNPRRPFLIESQDKLRTYHLQLPLKGDEAEWSEGLLGMGATTYSRTQILQAMREAILEHLTDEFPQEAASMAQDLEEAVRRLEEVSERYRNQRTTEAEEAVMAELEPTARIMAITEVVNRLNEEVGPLRYNEMVATNAKFSRRAGILALRLFGKGWEGEGLPTFERGMGGVAHKLIAQVPDGDLVQIGNLVAEQLRRDPVRLGNSPSPSSRSSSPSPGSDSSGQPPTSP